MNSHIKQLALEAGYTPDMFGVGHWDMPECKKFAELIVRECIQSIQNESMDSGDEWEDGLQIAEGAVREHFGVEE